MMNVLEQVPYQEDCMGKRKLVDEKHLLIMQIGLKPGQQVPEHKANSNVHLLILKGSLVSIILDGVHCKATEGDIVPVNYQTKMNIKNIGTNDITFLVIKTPNPKDM